MTAALFFDQLISGDSPTSWACWESEWNTSANRALIISIRAEKDRDCCLSYSSLSITTGISISFKMDLRPAQSQLCMFDLLLMFWAGTLDINTTRSCCTYVYMHGGWTMMWSVGRDLNHVTDKDEAQQLQWDNTQVRKHGYYQQIWQRWSYLGDAAVI